MYLNHLYPSFAENIYNLNKGDVYGPYNENGFVKATKLIDSKFIADSAKVRHILILYTVPLEAVPDVTKSKEQAKKTADSI